MDYNYQNPYTPKPQPEPRQPYIPPQPQPPFSSPYGQLTGIVEESYIENILRLNRGKVGTFYFTYTDSNEWRDRVYKGVIEAAGKDHLILSDPKTGKRQLLQLLYFDYAEFDEEINYDYPFR
jgi:spore germination protein Q